LRPAFDAVAEFEALMAGLGHPGTDIETVMRQGMFSGMRAVVWCLLQDEHAAEIKTLKDASRWIERAGGIGVVSDWVNRSIELNQPPQPEGAQSETRPQEAQVGTGEPSSSELVGSV
jgi:hypothetical protein